MFTIDRRIAVTLMVIGAWMLVRALTTLDKTLNVIWAIVVLVLAVWIFLEPLVASRRAPAA